MREPPKRRNLPQVKDNLRKETFSDWFQSFNNPLFCCMFVIWPRRRCDWIKLWCVPILFKSVNPPSSQVFVGENKRTLTSWRRPNQGGTMPNVSQVWPILNESFRQWLQKLKKKKKLPRRTEVHHHQTSLQSQEIGAQEGLCQASEPFESSELNRPIANLISVSSGSCLKTTSKQEKKWESEEVRRKPQSVQKRSDEASPLEQQQREQIGRHHLAPLLKRLIQTRRAC